MFLITKQLMICTSITFYTPASSSSLASLVYYSNNNFWNIILKEMACGCIRSRCKCYFWNEDNDVTLRNTVLLLFSLIVWENCTYTCMYLHTLVQIRNASDQDKLLTVYVYFILVYKCWRWLPCIELFIYVFMCIFCFVTDVIMQLR